LALTFRAPTSPRRPTESFPRAQVAHDASRSMCRSVQTGTYRLPGSCARPPIPRLLKTPQSWRSLAIRMAARFAVRLSHDFPTLGRSRQLLTIALNEPVSKTGAEVDTLEAPVRLTNDRAIPRMPASSNPRSTSRTGPVRSLPRAPARFVPLLPAPCADHAVR
jgi:hypothetical protein